jgi:CubicO group peptidase (beta-lactamase class C family)
MKKPYLTVFSLLISLLQIDRAIAADDSLLYRIGHSDPIETDIKTFVRNPDSFLIDMIASTDGTRPDPDDFTVTCQMTWNKEELILFINVLDNKTVVSDSDDQLWANDCIELFLAPAVGSGSYYQLVLAVDTNGTLRSRFYDFRKTSDAPLKHSSASIKTASGYRIVTRIPWSNLGIEPVIGTEIGVQIFANDSDGDNKTLQLQWYPHAQSHNSDWMHRVQLQKTTTDKHLTSCTARVGQDDIRLDIFTARQSDLMEFDVLDSNSQKVAVGFLQKMDNGLKKASVLLPLQESYPIRLRFMQNGNIFGQTAIVNPAAMNSERIKALQEMMLVPKSKWGYLFEAGGRPEVMWSKPETMKAITGNDETHVRWFDGSVREVTSFDKPGRYLAYAQSQLPDGRILRRSTTFYAIPANSHPWRDDTRLVLYNRTRPWWHPWRGAPLAQVDFLDGLGFDKKSWQDNQPLFSAWAGKTFFEFLESDPYGPVILSYLSESGRYAEFPANAQTPEIVNAEIQLALKRRLLGEKDIPKPLQLPQNISPAGPQLHEGQPGDAGFTDDAPKRIRDICTQWVNDSSEPFVVLIAKDGVVFFHEAFGLNAYGNPVTVDTPMFMASITKCMTGLMFGQFVDQGLIGIDEPIGHFLPDFPVKGDKIITFRHCFTHTTGLTGHYEFGGMHNPWLENAIAMGLPQVPVGKVHEYNGMGYDLAGKAMEVAAGKSALRMMHENLFVPLGMTHTVLDDMATCTTSTPKDIARLGQLILNGGAYNGKRFFSPETLDRLLPCELNQYFPDIQKNWGIGMTWMLTADPEADKTGRPYLMSSKVVGHGAASSAVFRVDLENKLIVVQTRNQAGRNYDKYLLEFLKTIDRTMKR